MEVSGNPLLLRLYDAIAELLTESIHQTAAFPEDPCILHSHGAVVDAIRSGDPDAAGQASYDLIDAVKNSIQKSHSAG